MRCRDITCPRLHLRAPRGPCSRGRKAAMMLHKGFADAKAKQNAWDPAAPSNESWVETSSGVGTHFEALTVAAKLRCPLHAQQQRGHNSHSGSHPPELVWPPHPARRNLREWHRCNIFYLTD